MLGARSEESFHAHASAAILEPLHDPDGAVYARIERAVAGRLNAGPIAPSDLHAAVVAGVDVFRSMVAEARAHLTDAERAGVSRIAAHLLRTGVELSAVLGAVRSAVQTMTETVLWRAESLPAGPGSSLLTGEVMRVVLAFSDHVSAVVIEEYETGRASMGASAADVAVLFSELLEGDGPSEELERRADRLGVDFDRPRRIALSLSIDPAFARDLASMKGSVVVSSLPGDRAFTIVVVSEEWASQRSQLAAVAARHGQSLLATGAARSAAGLRVQYGRALQLLTRLPRIAPDVPLVELAGLLEYELLVAAPPDAADALITEVLGPILDLRHDRGSALLRTLSVLLEHSPKAAAVRLSINTKTVYRHIAEIQRLTGLSPTGSGAEVFRLGLGLRVLSLRETLSAS